jgi:hypothetical protein
MARLTLSEMYPIASVVALFIASALNVPTLTLGVALIGLSAGLFLLQRNALTRAGMLGIMGFAVAGALALYALLR